MASILVRRGRSTPLSLLTVNTVGRCRSCGLCGFERVAPVRGWCIPGNGHGDINLPQDNETSPARHPYHYVEAPQVRALNVPHFQ